MKAQEKELDQYPGINNKPTNKWTKKTLDTFSFVTANQTTLLIVNR